MLKRKIFKVLVREEAHKRPLVTAYNEKCFWVQNGPVLSNLPDLLRALRSMSDAQFSFHVNRDKNDFAHWVEDTLHDPELGRNLRGCESTKSAAGAVERRLKDYQI